VRREVKVSCPAKPTAASTYPPPERRSIYPPWRPVETVFMPTTGTAS
jgi:hypothetical protein